MHTYQNLDFQDSVESPVISKTLFVQYKHSRLDSQTSPVHISTMNAAVNELDARLRKHNWEQHRWIFLWVTNRDVEEDVTPDARLLWVDKSSLADHAPLLGTRGLVPLEELREKE